MLPDIDLRSSGLITELTQTNQLLRRNNLSSTIYNPGETGVLEGSERGLAETKFDTIYNGDSRN